MRPDRAPSSNHPTVTSAAKLGRGVQRPGDRPCERSARESRDDASLLAITRRGPDAGADIRDVSRHADHEEHEHDRSERPPARDGFGGDGEARQDQCRENVHVAAGGGELRSEDRAGDGEHQREEHGPDQQCERGREAGAVLGRCVAHREHEPHDQHRRQCPPDERHLSEGVKRRRKGRASRPAI